MLPGPNLLVGTQQSHLDVLLLAVSVFVVAELARDLSPILGLVFRFLRQFGLVVLHLTGTNPATS